jgi:hypothetical protein
MRSKDILKNMSMNIHIFTEVIRCGKIAIQAINSFHKYHKDLKLNIYCAEEDIEHIPSHENNIIHLIKKDSELYNAFDNGHKGTSKLWSDLILDLPSDITHMIHFDSDVMFFGNAVDDIIDGLKTHDLVGPNRNYIHNPNGREDVRKYNDVVQTYCFGFNRKLVSQKNRQILHNWVRGYPVEFPHPVIDFFDPVSFNIIYNGGKVKHMHEDQFGGTNFYGKRTNKYEELNSIFDVGDKIVHFASVGSGLNFYNMMNNKKIITVPMSYVQFSLKRFDIYSRLFFDKKILKTSENDELIEKMTAFIKAHE